MKVYNKPKSKEYTVDSRTCISFIRNILNDFQHIRFKQNYLTPHTTQDKSIPNYPHQNPRKS